MLAYDEESLIFKLPSSKSVIWLPSLLFGSGGFKSIITLRSLPPSTEGNDQTCTYELTYNAIANVMAYMLFNSLFAEENSTTVVDNNLKNNVEKEFTKVLGIITITMSAFNNYIPYLDGPLVPFTAKFRELKKLSKVLPKIIITIPKDVENIEEIHDRADGLLRSYASYLIERVGI